MQESTGKETTNYINVNKHIKSITADYNPASVQLCIYRISGVNTKPFVEYLLYKHSKLDILTFPMLNTPKIKSEINNFLKTIFVNTETKILGYNFYENTNYVYVEVNQTDMDIIEVGSSNIWWWVTIDEIVNLRQSMGYNIHGSVSKYFLNHEWMCTLYNLTNDLLEVPSVVYIGGHLNEILFQTTFGLVKRSFWNSLGPFYVFNIYENAVKNAIKPYERVILPNLWKDKDYVDSNGYNKKSGIIRCVIFVGKQRVFLNSKLDDESLLTEPELQKIMNKTPGYKKRLLNLTRLKDNDGDWANNYDSAMISGIPVDGIRKGDGVEGDATGTAYTMSVSDINNILLLSYGSINKNTNLLQ